MRPLVLAAAIAAALAPAGCGSGSGSSGTRAPAAVRLTVSAPVDEASTRGATVTVSGTVAPGDAGVRVLGRSADVIDGSFTVDVPVDPGSNVIDVMATARGRGPAMTAVRVTRQVAVVVPDLSQLTAAQAGRRTARLGLRLRTQEGGGLLEPILPGTPTVCTQQPSAGKDVARGSRVLIVVSKTC
jgi:hypothetical protein